MQHLQFPLALPQHRLRFATFLIDQLAQAKDVHPPVGIKEAVDGWGRSVVACRGGKGDPCSILPVLIWILQAFVPLVLLAACQDGHSAYGPSSKKKRTRKILSTEPHLPFQSCTSLRNEWNRVKHILEQK